MSNPPQNFGELNSPPPLKCTLVQKKGKDSFLKKRKILFPTLEKNTFGYWNMNTQLQNLKIEGELGVF